MDAVTSRQPSSATIRIVVKRVLGALLLAGIAVAGPDGAVAPASRWTGPHGPPSNSRRSHALAVTRDVVEAWSVELPGRSVASPVTWDGRLYVLCTARRGMLLCLFSLESGELVAKKQLPKAPEGDLHAWGRSVFVRTAENEVAAFRPAGSSLIKGWSYAAVDEIGEMRVLENEIYVIVNGNLLRLSTGSSKPDWEARGRYFGPPAVYGGFVFCMSSGRRDSTIKLEAVDRRSGGRVRSVEVAYTEGSAKSPAELMVSASQILVSPVRPFAVQGGSATHAFVPFSYGAGKPVIGECDGLSSFGTWPAACRDGVLTMEEGRRWMWWKKEGGLVLAQKKWTPELFRDHIAPTVLGDVAYFGTWAADIVTGEVMWRLPVGGVRHSPVPADKLVVIVDKQDVLRAYRER